MRVSEFHYDLPEELIAQHPAPERTASRLLCLDADTGALEDRRFSELPALLREGDLLVLNDTRVLPARLFAVKATGGRVEVLLERIVDEHRALAQLRASKTPAVGQRLLLAEDARATVTGRRGEFFELRFSRPLPELLERAGVVPLPPYIRRAAEPADRERYQTVYARREGAVAAPTAGLHFDETLLERLRERGVGYTFVTVHVGAGTFRPVRVERVEEHRVPPEHAEVTADTVSRIRSARGRIVAVGTTSVRALETAAQGGELAPYRGDTHLFIYPGYRFRCVQAMITNFHLPESSLLMLVAAFAGREQVLAAYRHAVAKRYRFYSYGDAMFLYHGSQQ
ncbi:MAG: tRNA preQ1(34) S-adenosylmethionine ribosyltransferase-isomerase QueA [Gammaproteobacteria bacterium]|nr:tRNA preQ1(34) S-adenosylmethionine ribosyltransferase-isomerase QueA [Gammaproteobacteria bacterium]NIR82299.1 tRNA preQ1(34) S-adenosylmethionine ribosyltransferase-isomerase QueA [Gammaproteobacteria bacterium]NIR91230.1 tRNA preQ1(34) S-adenosylmethionine ribosyltransferase-isomerase QueA [Gammaproteobacteria bacterium]NIU03448.1 tRNA preQ1(34) S-adenosylmethionine ribosyltransferase-isomerase QueA [Gammaproteobacteria bacterium]NIX84723.1 tRNA preQ1(34) S-adenosylmethionine ribosyltrans